MTLVTSQMIYCNYCGTRVEEKDFKLVEDKWFVVGVPQGEENPNLKAQGFKPLGRMEFHLCSRLCLIRWLKNYKGQAYYDLPVATGIQGYWVANGDSSEDEEKGVWVIG